METEKNEPMTIDQVLAEVEDIKALSYDNEAAHSLEDSLRRRVLAAIAEGAENPQGLAKAALLSSEISFVRWCA